ncbi:MAG TPA: PLP-dependent lyase/thiolase [Acidimicrobiia bacterium]|nr:PLP-dependent lyase/thiolase [Acidimicrobiia bacterium]
MTAPEPVNPFLRYRARLDSYSVARSAGWSDADFVALVERLDDSVAGVEGHGFVVTPCEDQEGLAQALDLAAPVFVKDDTRNVSGSHKARHLFGVMLHLAVAEQRTGELAIASCGNAAVAAATVARAMEMPLRVFIPTWADPAVVRILTELGAAIEVAERRAGEQGDPTYLRFQEAVGAGAIPFSVQGTSTPTAIDGGRTIGWELADQLDGTRGRVRLFVQVGGGALASAAWRGLDDGRPRPGTLHAVQTEACAPLARAWRHLTDDLAQVLDVREEEAPGRGAALARRGGEARRLMVEHGQRYMWPWEPVGESVATGILDDVTYDWKTVLEPIVESGGWPIVVTEQQVVEANRLGRLHTGIDVDSTGTAGLAGLLDDATASSVSESDVVVLLFTGRRR